jgi:sugar lactone lactonase YvrE
VITPDGLTLIVAETWGFRLTAFDIGFDGSLSGRRVWAKLEHNIHPDGICLDVEGAIWVANAYGNDVIRIKQGGEVTHHLQLATNPFACTLGGQDGCTLFVLTVQLDSTEKRSGRLEVIKVETPHAGLP